jgi:hypothetical protein
VHTNQNIYVSLCLQTMVVMSLSQSQPETPVILYLNIQYAESEVPTKAVTKSPVFWDIMPCSLLKVNRHFRGTCGLGLQGRRISQETSMMPCSVCYLLHTGFLATGNLVEGSQTPDSSKMFNSSNNTVQMPLSGT